MLEALAILSAFSVPLSLIGSITYFKLKKLEASKLNTEEREVLAQIKAENAELRKRLENVEILALNLETVEERKKLY
jgi:hypothetical protein